MLLIAYHAVGKMVLSWNRCKADLPGYYQESRACVIWRCEPSRTLFGGTLEDEGGGPIELHKDMRGIDWVNTHSHNTQIHPV